MHFTRFISTDRPHCKDEPGTDLQQTISDRHLGDSASVFGLYGAIQMLLLLLLLLNSLICMPGCRMKDDSCRATRMQLLKNSNSMTGSDGWIATKTLAIKDIINFVVFLISNFSFRYAPTLFMCIVQVTAVRYLSAILYRQNLIFFVWRVSEIGLQFAISACPNITVQNALSMKFIRLNQNSRETAILNSAKQTKWRGKWKRRCNLWSK